MAGGDSKSKSFKSAAIPGLVAADVDRTCADEDMLTVRGGRVGVVGCAEVGAGRAEIGEAGA